MDVADDTDEPVGESPAANFAAAGAGSDERSVATGGSFTLHAGPSAIVRDGAVLLGEATAVLVTETGEHVRPYDSMLSVSGASAVVDDERRQRNRTRIPGTPRDEGDVVTPEPDA